MDKKIKVAINGIGRIGRAFLKIAFENPMIEIIAGNDLGNLENIAYLIKYDSIYGTWDKEVKANKEENCLEIEGERIKFYQEPDPSKLPWKELDIDVVLESTGVFDSFEKASAHLSAGAKKVVISAPAKDDNLSMGLGATVLLGANENDFGKTKITSNGSCTTCAVAPTLSVLIESIGVEKALLNTIHAYTATQNLVDGPSKKDFRRGRSANINIVPSTTGATIATGKAIKEIRGFFDGISLRIPLPIVSLADITFISKKETDIEEIKDIFRKAANNPKYKGILRVEENQIVSSDVIKDTHLAIVDLSCIRIVGGNLIKLLVWYDNEWGYSYGLVEHVIKTIR
jgi:glyceraldehyde 3-phosphate dehydrogenase